MRNKSHTLITSLRGAVIAWRKREGWSREAVASEIARLYAKGDGELITGFKFLNEKDTPDAFARAHANAERIFRWLDDETKDTNLLPANIYPFILQTIPMDLRIECVNESMEPANLSVQVFGGASDVDLLDALKRMYKETGDANSAAVSLLDGATPEELRIAQREFTEAIAAFQGLLPLIQARLTNGGLDE
jgi:hypothetical protein